MASSSSNGADRSRKGTGPLTKGHAAPFAETIARMRTVSRGTVLAAGLVLSLSCHPREEQIGARATGDERFLIKMNGVSGYIDRAGKIIIPPKYTLAWEFRENRAFFGRDGHLYGFLDSAGREIIPMRFVGGASFSEGMALVSVFQTNDG